MSNANGRVAIVTGGGKGFGYGIAAELVSRGAIVYITGRDTQALQTAANEIGALPLVGDVTNGDDWDRVVATVQSAHGRIDILINNAGGGGHIAPSYELSDDEVEQCISQNLTGAMFGCRRVAPIMMAQREGTIVNIGSVAGHQAWPAWGVYGAAKAGLAHYSRALYTEVRAAGVRVTTFTPSWGATQFDDASGLPPRDADTASKTIQPSEIGKLVADLCDLPGHLWVQETILWPMVQQVEPL